VDCVDVGCCGLRFLLGHLESGYVMQLRMFGLPGSYNAEARVYGGS
jgi:hypothetical protein